MKNMAYFTYFFDILSLFLFGKELTIYISHSNISQ